MPTAIAAKVTVVMYTSSASAKEKMSQSVSCTRPALRWKQPFHAEVALARIGENNNNRLAVVFRSRGELRSGVRGRAVVPTPLFHGFVLQESL